MKTLLKMHLSLPVISGMGWRDPAEAVFAYNERKNKYTPDF